MSAGGGFSRGCANLSKNADIPNHAADRRRTFFRHGTRPQLPPKWNERAKNGGWFRRHFLTPARVAKSDR